MGLIGDRLTFARLGVIVALAVAGGAGWLVAGRALVGALAATVGAICIATKCGQVRGHAADSLAHCVFWDTPMPPKLLHGDEMYWPTAQVEQSAQGMGKGGGLEALATHLRRRRCPGHCRRLGHQHKCTCRRTALACRCRMGTGKLQQQAARRQSTAATVSSGDSLLQMEA